MVEVYFTVVDLCKDENKRSGGCRFLSFVYIDNGSDTISYISDSALFTDYSLRITTLFLPVCSVVYIISNHNTDWI